MVRGAGEGGLGGLGGACRRHVDHLSLHGGGGHREGGGGGEGPAEDLTHALRAHGGGGEAEVLDGGQPALRQVGRVLASCTGLGIVSGATYSVLLELLREFLRPIAVRFR